MKQWLPLKIVLVSGLFMLIQYFVPHKASEFVYEYALDFIIIIGFFALALGIWSLGRVSFEKIHRNAPGWGDSWGILIGLVVIMLFGFIPNRIGNIGDRPTTVAIGDMDFDDDNDLVVSNKETQNISVFKNRGNGLFVPAYTYPAGDAPGAMKLCDIDDDGDLDVLVANENSQTISVIRNIGRSENFIPRRLQITSDMKPDSAFNVGPAKLAKPMALTCGAGPSGIAVGDLNGDGKGNDFAVANRGAGTVSLFINKGDGSYGSALDLPSGTEPVAVYIADFNRDYINDIVVANAASADISLMPGDGAGQYQPRQSISLGNLVPSSLATGDFDGNGWIDLAVAGLRKDDNAGLIIIMKSDSLGLFISQETFNTGAMPISLVAEDLDQDGFRDLVVACNADNNLYIHKNDGQGGFAQSKRMYAGRGPVFVTTGRLDQSGRASLAVANQGSNNVATMTNRGGMDFEPGLSLEAGDILFLGGNISNYFYVQLFQYIMIPIQSTMFSLLAFYIASAAYRAFRIRSLLSSILLLAALIIMIRFVPLGPISDLVSNLSSWILKVPNMAAKRAIFIGVGLGGVATAIKILLGIERGYMGRD